MEDALRRNGVLDYQRLKNTKAMEELQSRPLALGLKVTTVAVRLWRLLEMLERRYSILPSLTSD